MNYINRPQYMQFLEDFRDNEAIKVITGIRRSGKTFLMNMFIQKLKGDGIQDDQIIHINFENFAFIDIRNAKDLYDYVHQHQNHHKKNYLFFDEIQHVKEWEKAINSFRVDMDADIYITGSNAFLLSSELATLLTGRYVQLKVYPLSFKEYYNFKNGSPEKVYQLFKDYLLDGGFPAVDVAPNTNLKDALKRGIFDSIILSDVSSRLKANSDQALLAVCDYLMSEIGNLVSATKIANTLRSNGFKISTSTVINYLDLLQQSFLFYKTNRYDLRGKKWFSTQHKYYFVDNGLRNTLLNKDATDNLGHQLENVVYIELLRRGYSVDVGKYNDKEIDFIARKGSTIEYYQITQQIPDANKRETDNLRFIPDGYKKVVLTLNRFDTGNINGINVKYVLDWLLR